MSKGCIVTSSERYLGCSTILSFGEPGSLGDPLLSHLREPTPSTASNLTATPPLQNRLLRLDIPEKYIATLGTNVDCGHGVIQAELDHRSLVVDFLVEMA